MLLMTNEHLSMIEDLLSRVKELEFTVVEQQKEIHQLANAVAPKKLPCIHQFMPTQRIGGGYYSCVLCGLIK